jgi:crotonobetainyl-CoA:carnitine CoA-transferase CaiB-like acyl-CoA transferase
MAPRVHTTSKEAILSRNSFSKRIPRRAGHDVNYMALAGMIGISGKPNTVPPLPGFQGADASGALQVSSLCTVFSTF